jgi:hypothetical protein
MEIGQEYISTLFLDHEGTSLDHTSESTRIPLQGNSNTSLPIAPVTITCLMWQATVHSPADQCYLPTSSTLPLITSRG